MAPHRRVDQAHDNLADLEPVPLPGLFGEVRKGVTCQNSWGVPGDNTGIPLKSFDEVVAALNMGAPYDVYILSCKSEPESNYPKFARGFVIGSILSIAAWLTILVSAWILR